MSHSGRVHLLLVIYVPDTLYHTDQPAEVRCVTCMDDYCDLCFYAQHRKGSRKKHPRSLLVAGRNTQSRHSQSGVVHVETNGQEVRPSHPSHTFLMPDAGGYGREDDETEGEVDTVSSPVPISDMVLSLER